MVKEPLMVEESVVSLLDQVVRSACKTAELTRPSVGEKQRDIVHHIEFVLSRQWGECLSLRDLANEVGISVYHLCRLFRRATGSTLHQYRQSCASAGLLRASWNRRDLLSILPWTRDFPAIAITAVPSARNSLKPHRASESVGLNNLHFVREQYFDSEFARQSASKKGHADKRPLHHRECLFCCVAKF